MMDNARIIWDYFIGCGLSAYAVAGLMGNLYAESVLNPRNLQNGYEGRLHMTDDEYTRAVDDGTYKDFDSDLAGYGLAQWTYPARKHNLHTYAINSGKSIGDLGMQLEFIWQELHGYTGVMSALRSATSVRSASDAVLTGYERPADQSEAMKVRRADFGQRYYDLFADAKKDAKEEPVKDARYSGRHFAEFCRMMLGQPYWYGTTVQKCTADLLARKSKQYPAHYTDARMAKYYADIREDMVATDCIGLLKGYMWSDGGEGVKEAIGTSKTFPLHYQENNCPDKSADGMFEWAKRQGMAWGGMDTMPEVVGLCVRKNGHVGYYVGGGKVIEAKGFNYGVVETRLKDGKWLNWYKVPFLSYGKTSVPAGDAAPANPATEPLFAYPGLLKRGAKGEAVKKLQIALNRLGFSCGSADGDFGPKTEDAVKRFQRAHGLEADGEFGPLTYAALKEAWR